MKKCPSKYINNPRLFTLYPRRNIFKTFFLHKQRQRQRLLITKVHWNYFNSSQHLLLMLWRDKLLIHSFKSLLFCFQTFMYYSLTSIHPCFAVWLATGLQWRTSWLVNDFAGFSLKISTWMFSKYLAWKYPSKCRRTRKISTRIEVNMQT